jgi:hypothetical protein
MSFIKSFNILWLFYVLSHRLLAVEKDTLQFVYDDTFLRLSSVPEPERGERILDRLCENFLFTRQESLKVWIDEDKKQALKELLNNEYDPTNSKQAMVLANFKFFLVEAISLNTFYRQSMPNADKNQLGIIENSKILSQFTQIKYSSNRQEFNKNIELYLKNNLNDFMKFLKTFQNKSK